MLYMSQCAIPHYKLSADRSSGMYACVQAHAMVASAMHCVRRWTSLGEVQARKAEKSDHAAMQILDFDFRQFVCSLVVHWHTPSFGPWHLLDILRRSSLNQRRILTYKLVAWLAA